MASKADTTFSNVSRRAFLKTSGALGAVAAATSTTVFSRKAAAQKYTEKDPDEVETAADLIYSTCQMCHARCGLRAKVKNGVLVKLDGNPYHPNTMHMSERPAVATDPADSSIVNRPGRLCPRGQAGVQTVYDPYRITQPLKRVGARGSGQWEAIDWNTAFTEIAAKINALIPAASRWTTDATGEPKAGKIANLLGFAPGRSIEKEMSERVWKHGFGTANYGLSHTSICEISRHLTNETITWDHTKASSSVTPSGHGGGKNKYGKGRTSGWQGDIASSTYVVLWGSNFAEAGFPMQYAGRNVARLKENGAKLVVIDPRFSNTAAKADWWIPVKPGGDQSLALGVLRVILANDKQDTAYLVNANAAAANADNHTTWTDSTYLVGQFTDASDGKKYWRHLTAADFAATAGVTEPDLQYLVWSGGAPTVVGSAALEGTLEPGLADQTLTAGPNNGETVPVRTAFELLKAGVMKHSLGTYAGDAGVTAADITKLANELTAGTTADYRSRVVSTYRGPVKHTNGAYAQFAIQHINTMLGNYDWKGGSMKGGGGYNHKSGVVSLGKVTGDPGHPGIPMDRHGKFYDAADAGSLFTGFPAKRPWGPFWTHTNYQEVIPSIADGYPYTMKVLITYWNAWPYSTPGLKGVFEELLSDESKIELLVSISPVMGELPAWADYILPDSTYLEKFGIPGIPWNASGGTAIQRPVVGDFGDASTNTWSPVTAQIDTAAKNDYRPVLPNTKTVLDIQIGLAKALGLDGTVSGPAGPVKCVGQDALVDGSGGVQGSLDNAWDWFHAILQNLAASSGDTIASILARGGSFWDKNSEYTDGPSGSSGTHMAGQYKNIVKTFADPWARTRDSITGEFNLGWPERVRPAFHDGTLIDSVDAAWPYRLVTYKTVNHGQARTAVNPWLMLRVPENTVDLAASDAKSLGVRSGDRVRVASPSNPVGIVGKARVTEGLRPGVVAISHHYGHWELSSKPFYVKDSSGAWTKVEGDPSRGAGITMNLISRLDTYNRNTAAQDPIGGSVSFNDTRVRVEKVA